MRLVLETAGMVNSTFQIITFFSCSCAFSTPYTPYIKGYHGVLHCYVLGPILFIFCMLPLEDIIYKENYTIVTIPPYHYFGIHFSLKRVLQLIYTRSRTVE